MTLVAHDRVGVLAEISRILGKAKINIDSVSAVSIGDRAILTFLLKNEKKAAGLLRRSGYHVLESEIFVVRLRDEPGALSALSCRMVDEKINIINLYIVAKEPGVSVVALKVDKPKKAKKLLAPYMNFD